MLLPSTLCVAVLLNYATVIRVSLLFWFCKNGVTQLVFVLQLHQKMHVHVLLYVYVPPSQKMNMPSIHAPGGLRSEALTYSVI